jgi:hypothetical protein
MIDKRIIGRYLSVYICIGSLYATFSFVLDLIYYYKYKSSEAYFGSFGGYLLFYFVYFYISLPISIVYNAIVNMLPKENIIRIIFGIFFGAIWAAAFGVPSYYGGTNGLKTLIEMAFVGLSVEIIRIIVVKQRVQKKIEMYESSL